jgi:hypothetical protein
MSDTITPAPDAPPEWATLAKDLLCPLCGYNLRGLSEGRCPECGFIFTWRELLEAERNKHLYVFEHGTDRNFATFWKTYWWTCRPRKFWTDLNPAQPVSIPRLVIYWMICLCAVIVGFYFSRAVEMTAVDTRMRSGYPSAYATAWWPLPWEPAFWNHLFQLGWARQFMSAELGWMLTFLIWPFATLVSLMVFRFSMRKAKIRWTHLLRTVIYACDFGVLFCAALLTLLLCDLHYPTGWLALAAAGFCSIVTTYRLTIAFNKYLRVHRPLETVLASQIISFLIVFALLVPMADFSRLM